MQRKIHILLAAVVIFVTSYGVVYSATTAERTVKTAVDRRGQQAHPLYMGAKYKRVTGTNEILVTSGTAILYGIVTSTLAPSNYLIFRDTDATNGSGDSVFGKVALGTGTFETWHRPQFPVLFNKGITVQVDSILLGGEVTVLYETAQ